MKTKEFIICDNLEDHMGYVGEPVKIVRLLDNDFYIVSNMWGKQWTVGEEEIKEI